MHTKASSHNWTETTTSPAFLTKEYVEQLLLKIYFPGLPILLSGLDIASGSSGCLILLEVAIRGCHGALWSKRDRHGSY